MADDIAAPGVSGSQAVSTVPQGADIDPTIIEKGSSSDESSDNKDEKEVTNLVKGISRYLLAFGLVCSVFCTLMDVTIIATAIPRITDEFHSIDNVGWYGSAYELSITAFQPTYGKLYTYFNLKWVFLTAIGLFELGSLIAALSTGSIMLIFGRAVAGLGSAGVFSGALAIVASSIPLKVRARYIGLLTSMFGIASVIGPFLGGVLTDISWRWCFWINLPLGFTAGIIVFFCFKTPKRTAGTTSVVERLRSFDYRGSILIIGAITCMLLTLQWGGIVYPWSNSKVWGTLLGFALLTVCFIWYQLQLGEKAVVPLRLVRNRTVWSASLCAWCSVMILYNHVYYLPFYFQAVKGTTAEQSGIHMLPYFISLAVTSVSTGFVISRLGSYTWFLITGIIIRTVGAGLISTFKASTTTGEWIGYQVLAGFGSGLSSQIPFLAIQATSEPQDIPLAMAVASFANSIGGAVTISVGQNILVQGLREYIPRYTTDVDTEAIIAAGAGDVQDLVPQSQLLGLREAYARSLDHTFAFPIAAGGLALIFALFVERTRTNAKPGDGEAEVKNG